MNSNLLVKTNDLLISKLHLRTVPVAIGEVNPVTSKLLPRITADLTNLDITITRQKSSKNRIHVHLFPLIDTDVNVGIR